MRKTGDTVTVSLAPNTEKGVAQDLNDVNCLLWAVGRDANTVDLGLDVAGEVGGGREGRGGGRGEEKKGRQMEIK